MSPVRHAVGGARSSDAIKRQEARALAELRLEVACEWCDKPLRGRNWACGEHFTLADCAAAPSLFHVDWTRPISERYRLLQRYRKRLLARPSFARAVEDARSCRQLFALGAPDRD